jgi:hypothetical protein
MGAIERFHTGMVVDDLEVTLAELTELFDLQWGAEVALPIPERFPDGLQEVDIRFRYSCSEPRLEVIQAVPGTMWTPVEPSGLHHVGCWSGDMTADAANLLARGYEVEAEGLDDSGAVAWAYFSGAARPRIELIDRSPESGIRLLFEPA